MARIRVRASVVVFDDDTDLHFLMQSSGLVKTFSANASVRSALRLLQDFISPEVVITAVRRDFPDIPTEEIATFFEVLLDEGIAEREAQFPYEVRYRKQVELFADMATSHLPPTVFHHKLRTGSAMLFGVGGAGTWVALSLALAGVGRIILIDRDIVAESNLNRQIAYGEGDVGRKKVHVCTEKIQQLNHGVSVVPIDDAIASEEDVKMLLDRHGPGIALNCCDHPSKRATDLLVGRACWKAGIPHLLGSSYSSHVGRLGPTVVPGHTSCAECHEQVYVRWQDTLRPGWRVLFQPRDAVVGSIGAICGMLGNMIAWEGLRVLAGLPPAMENRMANVDFSTMEMIFTPLPKEKSCALCGGAN